MTLRHHTVSTFRREIYAFEFLPDVLMGGSQNHDSPRSTPSQPGLKLAAQLIAPKTQLIFLHNVQDKQTLSLERATLDVQLQKHLNL